MPIHPNRHHSRRPNEGAPRHGRYAGLANQLSQLLHGEQGAMVVASEIVGSVPWMDAKYYASSQTMDEPDRELGFA